MKKPLALFRSALALLLALVATPGAACLRSCSAGAEDLACLRICAQSHALLSEHGSLPTLSSADCGVQLQAAPVLASVASFELSAPSLPAVVADIAPLMAAEIAHPLALALRGPPAPHPYLSTEHPRANAPPSYC